MSLAPDPAPLPLDDARWRELRHAYGSAADLPPLLRALADFPAEDSYQDPPWFGLWSALCHQGEVYPASFAALPHVVAALAADPRRARISHLLLPASIELARERTGEPLPQWLAPAYRAALARLPALAAAAAFPGWDYALCSSALAATAAATGRFDAAALLLQVQAGDVEEVLEWLQER